MKKLLPLVFIASTSFTNLSIAADITGLYIGAKSGLLSVDADTTDIKWDDAIPLGLLIGYQVPVEGGDFALEFEMNKADLDVTVYNQKGSLDFQTIALYGAYRSEGNFFYKLKAGFLKEEITGGESVIFNAVSESGTGLSVGFGGGVRLANNITIEAEYTIFEADIGYLSVGANFNF